MSELPGVWPKLVTAEDVFHFVRGIIESGREEEFLKECAERNVRISVLVEDMKNFKRYVEQREILSTSPSLRRVIDPNKCDC